MPTIQLDLSGLTNLVRRYQSLADLDFTDLVKQWEEVLSDDNVAGVMAGLDGDGNPMQRVTYRPTDPAKRRKPIDYTILPNNNLTSSHYRSLSGPPLAPRGMQSRVITNFRTSSAKLPNPGEWVAIGAWEGIEDVKGRTFLHRHFTGGGNLPQRDLRGVRPAAVEAARRVAREFVRAFLRSF